MVHTLVLGSEISLKSDLHMRRPKFLRFTAGFRKPFWQTETRGFAPKFPEKFKIMRTFFSAPG